MNEHLENLYKALPVEIWYIILDLSVNLITVTDIYNALRQNVCFNELLTSIIRKKFIFKINWENFVKTTREKLSDPMTRCLSNGEYQARLSPIICTKCFKNHASKKVALGNSCFNGCSESHTKLVVHNCCQGEVDRFMMPGTSQKDILFKNELDLAPTEIRAFLGHRVVYLDKMRNILNGCNFDSFNGIYTFRKIGQNKFMLVDFRPTEIRCHGYFTKLTHSLNSIFATLYNNPISHNCDGLYISLLSKNKFSTNKYISQQILQNNVVPELYYTSRDQNSLA